MSRNINVLLVSASSLKLNDLEDALAEHSDIASQRKLLTNSDTPLSNGQLPDLIVFEVNDNWDSEFDALQDLTDLHAQLPFIVIGQESDTAIMRQAMKAGARDFFTHPVEEQELLDSIRMVGRDAQMARRSGLGEVTTIINGKGGSGASVISSSLATTLVAGNGNNKNGAAEPVSVVLIDLDLQFGGLPVYFDLPSTDNLARAISSAGSLDHLAIEGLVQSHSSGVRLLSNTSETVLADGQFRPDDIVELIENLSRHFDHVLIDMPRHLGAFNIAVLEVSEKLLIPTRQTVTHVRDTMQLINLCNDIGISKSSMRVIVNQFYKKAEIRLHDMRETFEDIAISVIPEDFKHVDFAINNGVPVPVKWPKAPISRALAELRMQVWPAIDLENRKGLFAFR